MSHIDCLITSLENFVFEVVVHAFVLSRLIEIENNIRNPDYSENKANKFEEVVYIGDYKYGGALQCMPFDCWSDYS